LDRLRDEFEDDLTFSDAQRITEEIVRWLEGQDRSEEYPLAVRHSEPEEKNYSLMLVPEELLLLEWVTEELYYDQLYERSGETWIAPGMESVFTVWTSLALDPPDEGTTSGAEGAEDTASGFGSEDLGGAADALAGGGGDRGAGSQDGSEVGAAEILPAGGLSGAEEGNPDGPGTKININTVSRVVLESLLDPQDLPWQVVNDLLEYRNEVDEDAMLAEESEEYDDEAADLERAFYGDQETDPLQFFNSLDDLDKVDGWKGLDQETKDRVLALIDVQSEVFSVFLDARIPPQDWMQEERYEEPRGPVLRLRAVYWRIPGEDGVKLIPVLPWHEVPHSRWAVPDFQDRLGVFLAPVF